MLQIVRQKQNVHEVDEWLNKWRGRPGIDRVKVKSYVTWDGREDKINRLRLDPEPDASTVVCDKPWTSMTVLWDGRVVPCCFDYDGIFTLGNVEEQSLEEIWRGERLSWLRNCHREGNTQAITLCAKCKDKEGYPVKRWYYPLSRFFHRHAPLAEEWFPRNNPWTVRD